MNVIKKNKKVYKYESIWRDDRKNLIKDSQGLSFPYPVKNKTKWDLAEIFVENLKNIQEDLNKKKHYKIYNKKIDCLFGDKKKITTKLFYLNGVYWEDSLTHYIEEHNVKPSLEFIDFIFSYTIIETKKKQVFRIPSLTFVKYGKKYFKLDRNQLMILDALMKHGSYDKKYTDKEDKTKFRYSEHAGLLDFNHKELEKVIVSGKTNRVDIDDDEIYLPMNMREAYDFEYIFHTHPATPGPGGRAKNGILYEFPSVSDVVHFYEHYNIGLTQGSIVIAPEGLYVIRKYIFDNKKINVNRQQIDEFIKKMSKKLKTVQEESLIKYGANFTIKEFYSKIAQDTTFIQEINKLLHEYELHIDYQPRIKDTKNRWILDTIYLPVYAVEPKFLE